ncbi:MAG: hypothetical protein CME62_10495 [Halobacteriovoraceae bacterium]|nr:hypothetical protein [Halobacteriovoraceae bacterium]|tara:strand:- start:7081 stop:7521 length:441 start_codon:yes stop_codon:yes gene_type:complete
MKTLLTTLLILSSLTTAMASQNACDHYYSDRTPAEEAIENFMQTKLNIEKEDLVHLELLDYTKFTSAKSSVALALLSPIIVASTLIDKQLTFKDLKELGCIDTKFNYDVQFNRDGQFCTVNLKVKVKNSIKTKTTTVKQKYAPVCN